MWLYIPKKDHTPILAVARVLPCMYSKEQYKGSGNQGNTGYTEVEPSQNSVGCLCFRYLMLTNPQLFNSNHHTTACTFIFHHSLLHWSYSTKASTAHSSIWPCLSDDTSEKGMKEILESYKHHEQFQTDVSWKDRRGNLPSASRICLNG